MSTTPGALVEIVPHVPNLARLVVNRPGTLTWPLDEGWKPPPSVWYHSWCNSILGPTSRANVRPHRTICRNHVEGPSLVRWDGVGMRS